MNRTAQRGLSLIELMIAMVIGLLLVTGVVGMFTATRVGFSQDEKLSRLQDEGRFALAVFSRELSMGSYFGGMLGTGNIDLDGDDPVAPSDRVVTTDLINDCGPAGWGGAFPWALTLDPPVEHVDNVASAAAATNAFSCIGSGIVVPGTDLISIKRVFGDPDPAPVAAPGAGSNIYLRTNGTIGVLHSEGPNPSYPAVNPPPPPGSVRNYRFMPAIYYVQNFAHSPGDGIPTLCRDILDAREFSKQCLAYGIEDLQVEFGIDTDPVGSRDGVANVFIANPTAAQESMIVAARVFILARSQDAQTGYDNQKQFLVSNSTVLNPNPPRDGFYRRLFTATVPIRNYANFFATQ